MEGVGEGLFLLYKYKMVVLARDETSNLDRLELPDRLVGHRDLHILTQEDRAS